MPETCMSSVQIQRYLTYPANSPRECLPHKKGTMTDTEDGIKNKSLRIAKEGTILDALLAQATQATRSFVVPGKHSDGLSITWKFSDKQGKFGYFLAKITKVW